MKWTKALHVLTIFSAPNQSLAFSIRISGGKGVTARNLKRKSTVLRIASLDPQAKARSQAQHSRIDDELSSLCTPTLTNTHIAEIHSILDDGAGHINSDLARSIWQWENSHFPSNDDEPFPAKRLKYSTRDGLRLVDSIARSMDDDTGRRHADLVQEGVVALMRSAVLWDTQNSKAQQSQSSEEDLKAAFEAFARKDMETAMKRALTETRDNVGEERIEINLDLFKKKGLEQAMRMSKGVDTEEEDQEPQPHNKIVQPLREALEDANPTPVEIALSDMIKHDIGDFLERQLSELELKVIRMRFGLDKENIGSSLSSDEIAAKLDMEFFKVIEVEENALQKLREKFEDDYIGAYLDDDHAVEVSL